MELEFDYGTMTLQLLDLCAHVVKKNCVLCGICTNKDEWSDDAWIEDND